MLSTKFYILFILPFAGILALGNSTASGQDFRAPNIPGASNYVPAQDGIQIQGTFQQNVAPPLAGSNQSGFVPRSSGKGSGLVPVRPRSGTGTNQDVLQFRPEYPQGRTENEQRVLDQIRAGNFDGQISGTTPADRGQPRTIRQRYPDGKVQLVRQIVQDDDGNYYNHGPWQLFNRRGELMANGQFANGVMDGTWERWHAANSSGIFQTKPFNEFEGPFASTATFRKGKLDGVWVITDRHQRKIVEIPYQNGKRNGAAVWFYPTSERMQVVNFRDGLLDGALLEWDSENQLVRNDEYIAGKLVVRNTSFYRPKQKSSETFFLDGKLELDGEDSWWDAEPAEYVQNGVKVQHGPSMAWHSNGQRKMVGQYQNDVRVGPFVWWHENGTRALAGRYNQGQKIGTWTWWHNNGMKSIEGNYQDDVAIGQWIWWDEDGKVKSQEDFGDPTASSGVLIDPAANQDETDADGENETDNSDLKSNPPEGGIEEMEEIRPFDTYDDEFVDPSEPEDQSELESNVGNTTDDSDDNAQSTDEPQTGGSGGGGVNLFFNS